jgi:hypothetical protein
MAGYVRTARSGVTMTTELFLGIAEEGSEESHLEELGIQLRRELLESEIENVEPARTLAPEGTRSGLAMVAGALVASVSPGKLVSVFTVIVDWLRRGRSQGKARTVEVEIDGDRIVLTGASDEAEQQLMKLFVERHSAAGSTA